MSLFDLFRKQGHKEKHWHFSDFLLNASEQERKQVLEEAAIKANEEQMEVFKRASMGTEEID